MSFSMISEGFLLNEKSPSLPIFSRFLLLGVKIVKGAQCPSLKPEPTYYAHGDIQCR